MGIEIKKLYLKNYKLFSFKEIIFSEYLSVFDGPNGYGKTSMFDAIEFLITGTISRIKGSDVIAGNVGYSQNFLANNPEHDVLIKGEFCDENLSKSLVISLRISASPGTNKQNNPKNIESVTQAYVLPRYDIPIEEWKEYAVSENEISAIRCEHFGAQNISMFDILHYIHQEDRLAYFKQSETNRSKAISDLLGIDEEIIRLSRVNEAQKALKARVKSLKEEIDKRTRECIDLPKKINSDIPYEPIAQGNYVWDKETIGFNGYQSKSLFERFVNEINGIIAFVENKDVYQIYSSIQLFEEIPQNKRGLAIQSWIMCGVSTDTLSEIRKLNEISIFLTTQLEFIKKDDYTSVDWRKLCELIEREQWIDAFLECTHDIKTAYSNQTDIQKLKTSLINNRTNLVRYNKEVIELTNGLCPYCGYDWETEERLLERFNATKELIDNILGRENIIYTNAVQRCKLLYEENCKEALENIINSLNNNYALILIKAFDSFEEFLDSIRKCDKILNYLQQSSDKLFVENNMIMDQHNLDVLLAGIETLKHNIPQEYFILDKQYQFSKIYKAYFEKTTYLNFVTVEQLRNKEKYIELQYYASFDESKRKLELMKEQQAELDTIQRKMKDYYSALKKSIDSYQRMVVKQIEIPFFLYCSRLLQSYQGGQGVVIESKDSKIRFTAPGAEHDVLYTMSSGQLSAVLLAFSLVLNKIYAGDKFSTILIDDPIQCMDDINMISFVELLRRDFSNSQIIVSTHEDTFANYIKYKFSKYNLTSQSITLKNTLQ